MITIIHGSDSQASRNYLFEEKEKYPHSIIIDSTKSLTDVVQALSGDGLFGENKTIFLEEFFSEKKSVKDLEALVTYVREHEERTIYFWEKKEISTKHLKMLPKAYEKKFTVPTIIFTFLDAIIPHNTKKILSLYHQILENNDASYVLFMIIRQIRMLLAIKDSEGCISEVKHIASWQKEKLKRQAHVFSEEQLLQIHETLFNFELGQKTGSLRFSLDKELDFYLASF